MDWYLVSIILFLAAIAILLYRGRKKLEIKYFILFMRRTKRFADTIDNIARRSPRLWKAVSTVSIFVCFYYMAQGVYLLLLNAQQIVLGKITQPGLQLILPSLSSAGSTGPGYILIPFWFWLITIACILVPHELSHGIISREEKIRLKSVGVMLLAIFPGAFVEPDEEQLKKAKMMTRLRIYAAGSGANILVAFLVLGLMSYAIWPIATQPGVEILYVNASSPADLAGIKPNMTLYELDGRTIRTSYQEYLAGTGYFSDEIVNITAGQTITFTSANGTHPVKLASVDGHIFMGIIYRPIFNVDMELFLGTLVPLATMIWIFSLAVAIFNILPLYPLDGGLMIEALADRYAKSRSKVIVKTLSWIVFLIILYNFFGPSLMQG